LINFDVAELVTVHGLAAREDFEVDLVNKWSENRGLEACLIVLRNGCLPIFI